MLSPRVRFLRRARRTRAALRKNAAGLPRLSVFRSGRHIHAQVIDDSKGVTVVSASTVEADLRGKSGSNKDAASRVGQLVAERAKSSGLERVVFDRGGYRYHGRVRALAEGAREAGLKF